MIIQIAGNVSYQITLDPTVWIFDDRKIVLERAFTNQTTSNEEELTEAEKTANRWGKEIYQQKVKPPVNKSITRFEREKILKNTYVMPIDDFLKHAEVHENVQDATLVTHLGDVDIPYIKLKDCYLLFSIKGKPIREDGPVHLYFRDGSNQDNPIKGVKKIILN